MEEGESLSDRTDEEAVIDQSDDELQDAGLVHSLASSPNSMPIDRRKSSGYSRRSVEDPLLRRLDSTKTDISCSGQDGRSNQKVYIITEDLTIVISGFKTSLVGFAAYAALGVLTCGLAYLVLRWLPRWRVRLVGEHSSLRECSWVVVEVSCD